MDRSRQDAVRPFSGFHVTFGSGLIKYVGVVSVNSERTAKVIENAIAELTDSTAESYVSYEEYQDVVMVASGDRVSVTDYFTDQELFNTRISDISSCAQSTTQKQYMGFMTHQKFGNAMAVGYVLHVFKCDSSDTAKEVCMAVGQAFFADNDGPLHSPTISERRSGHRMSLGNRLRRRPTDTPSSPNTLSTPSLSPGVFKGNDRSRSPSTRGLRSHVSSGSLSSYSETEMPSQLVRQSSIQNQSSGDSPSEPESPLFSRAASVASSKLPTESVNSRYLVVQTAENLHRRFQQAGMIPSDGDTSFKGSTIISWLISVRDFAERKMALEFMNTLLQAESVASIATPSINDPFQDSDRRYRFVGPTSRTVSRVTEESGKGSSADDITDREGDASDSFDLMKAIARNSAEEFTTVLASLSEGSVTEKLLQSCLHHAIKMKSVKVAEVILQRDVSPESKNRNGDTALHRAAYFGDAKMVKLLLQYRADVNCISEADGSTPIFKAAERLRNIGCAILLVEHGAKLQIQNKAGIRPVDLSPDLNETRHRLCESIANKFADGTGNNIDMVTLRRLAANEENDADLLPLLKRVDTAERILDILLDPDRGGEEFCNNWIQVLELLFAPGIRRHRSTHSGMLGALVVFLRGPPALCDLALDIFADLAESHPGRNQKDCLKQIAAVDLGHVVAHVTVENRTTRALLAARVLGLVSIFQRAQATLSTARCIRELVDFASSIPERINANIVQAHHNQTTTDPNLESALLWVVRTLANIAKRQKSHQIFHFIGTIDLLKKLLTFQNKLVQRFVGRVFALLGLFDFTPYDILSPDSFTPHIDVLRGKLQVPSTAWSDLKGASLEKIVSVIVHESDEVVCHLFFLVYQTYCEPSTLFRLLTYPLHHKSSACNSITPTHDRILKLVKVWIERRLADFMDYSVLLEDLKHLIAALQEKGGLYAGVAGQLLDTTVDEHPQDQLVTGVMDYQGAAHHHLYEAAKRKVLSGDLPTTKELAVTLAAAQLYIEDLGQPSAGHGRPPQTKLKAVLPPKFSKGKETMEQVASEYERICGISLRDAKHLYLHICQLVAFDYFPVKQASPEKSSKRLPRLLGIGASRLILLNDKTKSIVSEFELAELSRWQLQSLFDKGKKYLQPAPPDGKGSTFLLLYLPNNEMLYLSGDSVMLRSVCDLLLTRTEALSKDTSGRPKRRSGSPDPLAELSPQHSAEGPHQSFICHCPASPMYGDIRLDSTTPIQLLKFPSEFARQLTVLEHGYFQKISAQELLDRVCKSKGAANCDTFVALFNLINGWVVTTILEQKTRDSRCSTIEQFVHVAEECLKLKNYNGVMEIVSALTSTPIRRLTDTWESTPPDTMLRFRELDKLMTAGDNFTAYRDATAEALRNPPMVPYFGILLKDLTLLHHGNPDYLSAGLLNVGKWQRIVGLLKDMEAQQRLPYNIFVVPELQQALMKIEAKSEEWIDSRSKSIQPSILAGRKSPRPSVRGHQRQASGSSFFNGLGFPSFASASSSTLKPPV